MFAFIRSVTLSLIILSPLIVSIPNTHAAWSSKSLTFSGYEWNIKVGHRGPGPNYWTSHEKDVFVDDRGRLHLSVVKHNGTWYSSEVALPQSLGYGTYQFELASRIDAIDQNLVFGPFMYKDDEHEFNMEFSRWKGQSWFNSYYTVQPFHLRTTNQRRFRTDLASDAPATITLLWRPDIIAMSTSQQGKVINSFAYQGINNFAPGDERLRLSFWQYESSPPSDGQRHEFIVNSFKFTPLE